MNRVDRIVEHAEQHCKSHGGRLTVKRKQVLAGLIQSEKALSAYELIDVCKQQSGESMPAMSVYRILEFLEDEHLVHKLSLANKYVACEIQPSHRQFISNCVFISSNPASLTLALSSSIVAGFISISFTLLHRLQIKNCGTACA